MIYDTIVSQCTCENLPGTSLGQDNHTCQVSDIFNLCPICDDNVSDRLEVDV